MIYIVYMIKREKEQGMRNSTVEMNKAIDNFVIRMAEPTPKKKTIEECTVDEYLGYLQDFCDFLGKE